MIFSELPYLFCTKFDEEPDLRPDFIPDPACGALSGTKKPVISARSLLSEEDRDDLRQDFIPDQACGALSGTKKPVISARSR